MNTTAAKTRRPSRWTPLGIAAFVLGFMVWWPLGLAILAYVLWGGSVDDLAARAASEIKDLFKSAAPRAATRAWSSSTGNEAFDAYREETLRRLEKEREETLRKLEEERREFEDFIIRLRQARDAEEFERFMAERKKAKKSGKSRKG